jgi:DNA-binding ferritin-like protein
MSHKSAAHAKTSPAARSHRHLSASDRITQEYLRKQGYMEGDPEELDQVHAVLLDLHAMVRAMHWMAWNIHWMLSGPSFYGDHLLFERFYDGDDEEDGDEGLQDDVDSLAEKILGYFGAGAICPAQSMHLALNWTKRWVEATDCPRRRMLFAEQDLQSALKITYEALKEADYMPLGLDDFLMGLAERHEVNIYLLQQVLGGQKTASAPIPTFATGTFAPIFERVSSTT